MPLQPQEDCATVKEVDDDSTLEIIGQPAHQGKDHGRKVSSVHRGVAVNVLAESADPGTIRQAAMNRLFKFAKESKSQVIPSVEAMQLARIWEKRYAGWDTGTLEAHYFLWKSQTS